MRRITVFFISLLASVVPGYLSCHAQDTISYPLRLMIGADVSGPAIYFSDRKILNSEAYASFDLNEKKAIFAGAGYMDYSYSRYNYDFRAKGIFVKAGIDYNLLKPDKGAGKYRAGIGLHYGMSLYNSEIPFFSHENFWGYYESSVPSSTHLGHFLEVSPGVRTDLFKNLSIGWSINVRLLLYSGSGKDMKPVAMPGYGNTGKTVTAGINYFIVWNIPFKKINVILRKEEPEETDETENPDATLNQQQQSRQQQGSRQSVRSNSIQ